ncbi:response regulator [Tunturiibacter gelidiferens]|uniref:Response regulator n=1 Tax=Tunturiibacter gelidiferens TaxID=3069689 RepID=A0AAU7YVJ7_9BACT
MPHTKIEHSIVDDEILATPKILLVDDDETTREILSAILETSGFQVVVAANVNDALSLIGAQTFDVLLSDLHMPNPGDGLTVVSAMRHANPKAVTLILSSYPAMKEAAEAILLQADGVLVKPMAVVMLVDLIRGRLKQRTIPARVIASVADILEEETQSTISDWLLRVELEPDIITIPLGYDDRTAHLLDLFSDLVCRLRYPLPLGTRALVSTAAAQHGVDRRRQGYTAAMMVEESRMVQVSIFHTLQNNLYRVNLSLVLVGVMTIADEVDSQLAQAMASYVSESNLDALPVVA